jgi:hypothetical protein
MITLECKNDKFPHYIISGDLAIFNATLDNKLLAKLELPIEQDNIKIDWFSFKMSSLPGDLTEIKFTIKTSEAK